MRRYGSARTVTTTTTTEDTPETSSERSIRRLRLTLHPVENGKKEPQNTKAGTEEKEMVANGEWKKKNGLTQRGKPAGSESPEQHHRPVTNGVRETPQPQHGPKVYGVVQRTGSDSQQEVMARHWSVNHLQDEMRYIREVRDSLEKVRERMYGQFGGMQQSMQKLSQDLKSANSQRRSLEAEVRVRTAAMDSFDDMNSSLISANIGLQKSLLESCHTRVGTRDEVRSLRSTWEKTESRLREKERQLAAAEAENRTLRLKVETTQEANNQVVQEVTARLQKEHEEVLKRERQRHVEEIENLQARIDEYVRLLEEAAENARIAEAKIAERDQRICEVERLLDCMGAEKCQLQRKLEDCEQRLHLMELTDRTDESLVRRSQQLEGQASELRERIKHLNDMVFCQQRKVKGMIEEVESLRDKVAQKDMFISELLDRLAIVECENNELEDKLKYFMSMQTPQRGRLQTREIGVGCDLLPRPEAQRSESTVQSEPTQFHLRESPPVPHRTTLPHGFKLSSPPPTPPPPSRLESTLLTYSPLQYSRLLQSSSSQSTQLPDPGPSDGSVTPPPSATALSPEGYSPAPPVSRARSSPSQIYTPFMRLMEITAKINIE